MNKKKKGSIRLFHFFVIMLFLFLLAGISHVWLNSRRTQIGVFIEQNKKRDRKNRGIQQKAEARNSFFEIT